MQYLRIDLPELICEVFVDRARKRLLAGDNTAQYANNVGYIVNGDGSCEIVIKENIEGIMMFLEYGTGMIGSQYKHPEAKESGWEYGVNRANYIHVQGKGNGWFFQKTPINFVSSKDSYDPAISSTVFSRGILPVRYLYNTKKEIMSAYNNSRSVQDFVRRLNRLKGSSL